MLSEETVRNAMYDILFSQQGGVHDGKSEAIGNKTLDQAMWLLACKLGIRPVSLKPFYTVHWDGDDEVQYPHIKSHLSGRRYEIKMKLAVRTEGNRWAYVDDEQGGKDVVGRFERERGIGPGS